MSTRAPPLRGVGPKRSRREIGKKPSVLRPDRTTPPFQHNHFQAMYHDPPQKEHIFVHQVGRRGQGQIVVPTRPANSRPGRAASRIVPHGTKRSIEGMAQFGLNGPCETVGRSGNTPTPTIATNSSNAKLRGHQDDVLRAVKYRETLLLQLASLVRGWPVKRPNVRAFAVQHSSAYPDACRLLRNLSRDIREAGLRCVEKIVAWVLYLDPDSEEPTPFLWNGQDYLLKMYTDLDFVYDTIGPDAAAVGNFCHGNPLLLSEDEVQGRGVRSQLGRAHAAGVVILDVVKRARRKALSAQHSTSTVSEEDIVKAKEGPGHRSAPDGAGRTSNDRMDGEASSVEEDYGAFEEDDSIEPEAGKPPIHGQQTVKAPPPAHQTQKGSTGRESKQSVEEEEDVYDQEEFVDEDKSAPSTKQQPPPEPAGDTTKQGLTMFGDYEVVQTLGEGAYGVVYSAKRKGSANLVALKKFKEDEDEDEETADYVLKTQVRELKFLRKLRHPNIVNLIEDFETDEGLFLVFDLAPETCLQALERHRNGFPPATVHALAQQLCEAICYCHKNQVVHRDIKPENLLVSGIEGTKPILQLCDFGTARDEWDDDNTASEDLTHYVGSRWYRAPELLGSSTQYTKAVDIWSSGCIIAELASGISLFEGEKEADIIPSMRSLLGPIPAGLGNTLIKRGFSSDLVNESTSITRSFRSVCGSRVGSELPDLLSKMVTYLPQNRLDAQGCLQHPYFGQAAAASTAEQTRRMGEVTKILSKQGRLPELLTKIMEGKTALDEIVTSDLGKRLSEVPGPTMTQFVELVLATMTDEEKQRLVLAMYTVLHDAVDERVAAIKAWLSSQSRTESSIADVVENAERKQAGANRNEKKICEACFAVIAPLHHDFATRCVDDLPIVNQSIINQLMSMLSLTLQNTSINSASKWVHLDKVFNYVGIPSPLIAAAAGRQGSQGGDSYSILSPASKSLVMYMRMLDNGLERTPIVTTRESTLKDVHEILKSTILSRMRRASVAYSTPLGSIPVLIPYFRSAYGKKVVNGVAVEEGEGLGPRKELFSLISAQLQQSWVMVAQHHGPHSGGLNVSGEAGGAVVECQGDVDSVAVGHQLVIKLVVGPTPETSTVEKRVVTRVMSPSTFMVDKPLPSTFIMCPADVMAPTHPLLRYHQPRECVWINTNLPQNEENIQRFRLLGVLLGLTVSCHCTLDLQLPKLFFKILLTGSRYEPTMDDVEDYDPSVMRNLRKVETMSSKDFRDLLLAEGNDPESMTKDLYIRSSMGDLLYGDSTTWIYEAIRTGLGQVIPLSSIEELHVSDRDLRVICCGAPDPPTMDFDFEQVFHVTVEPEFKKSVTYQVFWEVVKAFDVKSKRKLLQFITGVLKLPAPGTEVLKIESPFVVFGTDDHKKLLNTLPQSHTCDNVIEVPNYYESLVKVWKSDHSRTTVPNDVSNELRVRCSKILQEKLSLAIDNAQGYGLDEVDSALVVPSPQQGMKSTGGSRRSITPRKGTATETDDMTGKRSSSRKSLSPTSVGKTTSPKTSASTSSSKRSSGDNSGLMDDIPTLGDEASVSSSRPKKKTMDGIDDGPSPRQKKSLDGVERGTAAKVEPPKKKKVEDDYEDDYEQEGFEDV